MAGLVVDNFGQRERGEVEIGDMRMVHDRTLAYLAIRRYGGGPADAILWTWITMDSEIYYLPLLLLIHVTRHNKGVEAMAIT